MTYPLHHQQQRFVVLVGPDFDLSKSLEKWLVQKIGNDHKDENLNQASPAALQNWTWPAYPGALEGYNEFFLDDDDSFADLELKSTIMSVWGHVRVDRIWHDNNGIQSERNSEENNNEDENESSSSSEDSQDMVPRKANHVIIGSPLFARSGGLEKMQDLATLFNVRIEVVVIASTQLRKAEPKEELSISLCQNYSVFTDNDPLSVALTFRNQGFPVHILDVFHDENPTADSLGHLLACNVLRVPCTFGIVQGLEKNQTSLPINQLLTLPGKLRQWERTFRWRDCFYLKDFDVRKGINFHPSTQEFWNKCKTAVPQVSQQLAKNTTYLRDVLQGVVGCEGSSLQEGIRHHDGTVLLYFEVLCGLVVIIVIFAQRRIGKRSNSYQFKQT